MKNLLSTVAVTVALSTTVGANPVTDAQNLLHNLGYNAGVVDGAYGGKTRRALEAFYKKKGGAFDGVFDANELTDLREEMDGYFLNTNTNFEFYTNIKQSVVKKCQDGVLYSTNSKGL